MAHSRLSAQCHRDDLHNSPARRCFDHFSDEESKARGGEVLHLGHRRAGGEAESVLQIIPTLKLLPGPFSGRDSRENVSQKKGRKEHVLGSNESPEPHP